MESELWPLLYSSVLDLGRGFFDRRCSSDASACNRSLTCARRKTSAVRTPIIVIAIGHVDFFAQTLRARWSSALEEFVGRVVVLDFRSPFVCLGKLHRADEHYLEMRNADLHDLRDTQTTREIYVASSAATGIKKNRKRVLVLRSEVVACSRIEDVVQG
jgi:hypothetical protein